MTAALRANGIRSVGTSPHIDAHDNCLTAKDPAKDLGPVGDQLRVFNGTAVQGAFIGTTAESRRTSSGIHPRPSCQPCSEPRVASNCNPKETHPEK